MIDFSIDQLIYILSPYYAFDVANKLLLAITDFFQQFLGFFF